MSVLLSSEDLRLTDAAMRALLTPLDHESVDAWRAAVLRKARELLRADTGSFLVDAEWAEPVYSDGVGPDVVNAYREYFHERDYGLAVRRREIGAEVWTTDLLWDRPTLERSEYWNDYKVPNRLFHAIGVTLDAEPGRPGAALHFHHASPGAEFGERERALLRLLTPALRVGVDVLRRVAEARRQSAAILDALQEGAAVFDVDGRCVHQNGALGRLLEADPRQDVLSRAVTRLAATVGATPLPDAEPVVPATEVATGTGRYRLAASVLPEGTCGAGRPVIVTVLRASPAPVSAEAITARFGLTRRESEVAALLVHGRSNAEVAGALSISTHTARHHTESILVKLGAKSRAQAGAAIRAAI